MRGESKALIVNDSEVTCLISLVEAVDCSRLQDFTNCRYSFGKPLEDDNAAFTVTWNRGRGTLSDDVVSFNMKAYW